MFSTEAWPKAFGSCSQSKHLTVDTVSTMTSVCLTICPRPAITEGGKEDTIEGQSILKWHERLSLDGDKLISDKELYIQRPDLAGQKLADHHLMSLNLTLRMKAHSASATAL